MIQPHITVHTADFNRAFTKYMTVTKKSLADVVNTKGAWIAYNAMTGTYKANAKDIREQMNQPSQMSPSLTVAEAMVASKNRIEGNRLTKAELKKQARRLIASRTRAVGFLRAGWRKAVSTLMPHADKKRNIPKNMLRQGARLGGALVAKANSFNPFASLWNSIEAEGSARAHSYIVEGAQRAIDRETADMQRYLERKLQKDADRFNR